MEKDLHGSADSLAVPALGESLHTASGRSGSWLLATVLLAATATAAAPALMRELLACWESPADNQ